MARTFVCDWTRWQRIACPANQLVIEGFGGVWLKATGAGARLNQPAQPFHIDPLFFMSTDNVLAQPNLIPGAFCYLVPGFAGVQAAFLSDVIRKAAGSVKGWLIKVDIEEPGVTTADVRRFLTVWNELEMGGPIWVYSSRNNWLNKLKITGTDYPVMAPYLEEAHWVDAMTRTDPRAPYASQQVKGIKPEWWDVNYGGWKKAGMVQFTDNALIASQRTTCSVFMDSQDRLRTYTHAHV
jgi:hypothetical protein